MPRAVDIFWTSRRTMDSVSAEGIRRLHLEGNLHEQLVASGFELSFGWEYPPTVEL